jgi:hypothetical protein
MATTASAPLPRLPSKQPPEATQSDLLAHQDRVIKALVAEAEKLRDLAERPLETWFNCVEVLAQQAEMYKGNTEKIDQAYILAYRTIHMGEP